METHESASNALEMFLHWEKTTPDEIFLRQPINDQWRIWTYKTAGDEIRKIAAALRSMQFEKGSNIALLSKNCAHFVMADIAIWMAGHVSVPLYPTVSAETISQILHHAGAKALFIGKLDNFTSQRAGIPSEVRCISVDLYGESMGSTWSSLLERYAPLKESAIPAPNELATIKYTSGTTGTPKGVMIEFKAIHFVTPTALRGFNLKPGGHRFFSYLPLSHIAERMLVEMGAIYLGASISFAESIEKFPSNLMDTQPTIFLGVPRIWAKFKEKIEEKLPNIQKLAKIPVVGTIIKRSIKKKLGLSKSVWRFTGAAPISVSMLEWFKNLGIEINEAYAMTENLAYSHVNIDDVRFGTVGKAAKGVQCRISDEGEIQVKHDGLMRGYFREAELTAAAFTSDGFLRTGDKGVVDGDGFLRITGRLKDQFKTDKAKFIDPAPLELELMSNPDIEQVCVVGVGIPQPIALTVLSAGAKAKGRDSITESLAASLVQLNSQLDSYSKIKAAIVLKNDWTIENGLLTPSMKVKRNEVEKIYMPKYLDWYKEERAVIWSE